MDHTITLTLSDGLEELLQAATESYNALRGSDLDPDAMLALLFNIETAEGVSVARRLAVLAHNLKEVSTCC